MCINIVVTLSTCTCILCFGSFANFLHDKHFCTFMYMVHVYTKITLLSYSNLHVFTQAQEQKGGQVDNKLHLERQVFC